MLLVTWTFCSAYREPSFFLRLVITSNFDQISHFNLHLTELLLDTRKILNICRLKLFAWDS